MARLEEITYEAGRHALAWKLKFSIDARELYRQLSPQAEADADNDKLSWLVEAGYGYQAIRDENTKTVRLMSRLSGVLGTLMIVQTFAWLAALAVE
jgi:hypothetical protein